MNSWGIHVTQAARRLSEIQVPSALNAAEEGLRASLRTAQTTALQMNFSCRRHGKGAAVSRWDGTEINGEAPVRRSER